MHGNVLCCTFVLCLNEVQVCKNMLGSDTLLPISLFLKHNIARFLTRLCNIGLDIYMYFSFFIKIKCPQTQNCQVTIESNDVIHCIFNSVITFITKKLNSVFYFYLIHI